MITSSALKCLTYNGKQPSDVLYVMAGDIPDSNITPVWCTWDEFVNDKKFIDKNGLGICIKYSLKIVGLDFMMMYEQGDRMDYWYFTNFPKRPDEHIVFSKWPNGKIDWPNNK